MSETEPPTIIFPKDDLEPGDEDLLTSEGLSRLLRAVRDSTGMTPEEMDAYLDSGGFREA